MRTAAQYMTEIVDPAIRDFEHHPRSYRHAFTACVVTFRCVDYLARPKRSADLRDQFRRQNEDFALIERVAHAFKHVHTGDLKNPVYRQLASVHVYESPPAMAGPMECGTSQFGDTTGGVQICGPDLLQTVKRAAAFLRSKLKP